MTTEINSDVNDLDLHPLAPDPAGPGDIPVVDLAQLRLSATAGSAAAAVDSIAAACRSWGFFQVVNHGISETLASAALGQARALFHLPAPDKLAVQRCGENPWGFYDRELTKNQRDRKEIFDFTVSGRDPIYRQRNRWPQALPQFERVMMQYLGACTDTSLTLLEGFCVGLGLPADFLKDDFATGHTGFVRLNYYPARDASADGHNSPESTSDLGIHHHTDAGALTLILQDDVAGLQVYRDGYWYDVPVIPGALVVNTGDMLQVWSNDAYQAPVHRVRAMGRRERFSIAFFFNPAAHCRVAPLPSVTTAGARPRYRPIHWGEFRGRRSDGDFADYGTEVQISQYRC